MTEMHRNQEFEPEPVCSSCGETCYWSDDADCDDPDPLCNPCAQQIASEVRKAPKAETEAERQVRRCAEALGYVGEPDRLAVAVGDACLAFAKDLREINARYMVRIRRLEEDLAVERNKTPINMTAPLAERLRLVRALEILGWPVGQEPELWAEQRAADTRATCQQRDDLDVELRRAREETAAMRVAWHAVYLELTRAKADLAAIEQRDVQVNDGEALDELMNQLAGARGKVSDLNAERDAAAKRLRDIMSTCFDGSRSGDLAFQLEDMEKWIPKFTSEWKANHRRWLDLCDRLGFDALDLSQHGRVAEVDAVAGPAFELRRIRAIVEDDARKRHGDREGEPSWGVIADCVLGHASQHRQARQILGVPETVTLDQYVTMLAARCQSAERNLEDTCAPLAERLRLIRALRTIGWPVSYEPEPWAERMASEISRLRHVMKDVSGESSLGAVIDCVLALVEQHRQAREILRVPGDTTIDQHVSMLDSENIATRQILEGMLRGRTADARPTSQLAREVVAQAERWRIDAEHYRGEASNATAKQVESLSAEVARLTGEVAATRAEAKRQIDAAIDRSQEAEKALMVVGWPGGDPIKWAHKVREDATPSSLTVAMYEAEVTDLVRQLLRQCASHNDLVKEIGRKAQAMRDLSRQFMEASPGTSEAQCPRCQATAAERPKVRCTGHVTVRINKDRVIVKAQTWTSDDPNFKAWDVSLHDDDPRFGFGGPEQRSPVGPTMELGSRRGTWTWRGSMGGFGDIKWQGAWTAEPKQAASADMMEEA